MQKFWSVIRLASQLANLVGFALGALVRTRPLGLPVGTTHPRGKSGAGAPWAVIPLCGAPLIHFGIQMGSYPAQTKNSNFYIKIDNETHEWGDSLKFLENLGPPTQKWATPSCQFWALGYLWGPPIPEANRGLSSASCVSLSILM